MDWERKIVTGLYSREDRPGDSISSAPASPNHPRSQAPHEFGATNLTDLELVQLVSMGMSSPSGTKQQDKFRLHTFFSGWLAGEAITSGAVDLIPSRFSDMDAWS